ncbi:Crp/Fnr family transcriptional regulator [Candidatus Acetothermia bacterium]|jgi:CRP/FNR family transcriptional regulator|nr:Crp/Fnr family transcriptional regulator [Candidatus Acetothermia bacterium]MCI2431346.1 Crp/Fnr family transcriptional regulator [Candidatus Acetothermia bacterium]MCI2437000.1 Crp/Fnr family transcriptional regulator [Candidatus Acetothermia bacterium]
MATGPPKMPRVNCAVCEASTSCLFTHLPIAERSPPNSLICHHTYAKGETIFRQGAEISGLYLLCHGKVKLARYTSRGQKQIVKFLKTGDLFGESGLLETGVASVYARALEESVVGWLSVGDFQELLKRKPPIALAIQRRLVQELDELRVRLTERSYSGTHERLVRLILQLGEKYGCRGDHGLVIDLKLTQVEIAGMLGDTREWVCKQMGALKSRGLIAYWRNNLVILDEAGLRQLIAPP